jgi:hypothetical protein
MLAPRRTSWAGTEWLTCSTRVEGVMRAITPSQAATNPSSMP